MERNSSPARIEHEALGSVSAEVHRVEVDGRAEIVLTRIRPSGEENPHATPVLLVHGNFSNRGFWISKKGVGLAPFLAERGYDAWVVELRGHGLSPKGDAFAAVTAEDHIQADLPAAVRYISEKTHKQLYMCGHSAGGVFIAGMLSAGCVGPEQILGAALFGAQVSLGEGYLKIPPIAWLSSLVLRLLGRLPAQRLGLGPEPEPAGEILEMIRWKRLGGRWADSTGFSYWEGLGKVSTPVLSVSGENDTNDPPEGCRLLLEAIGSRDKRFVLLSRKDGFSTDYDHIGMIVSKEAAKEVWPLLATWMDERRSR